LVALCAVQVGARRVRQDPSTQASQDLTNIANEAGATLEAAKKVDAAGFTTLPPEKLENFKVSVTKSPPTIAPTMAPNLTNVSKSVPASWGDGTPQNINFTNILKQLHADEAGALQLETQVHQLHHRLSHAEQLVVGFTQSVTRVRARWFGASARSRNVTWKLQKLTRMGAKMNSTLDLHEMNLNATKPQVGEVKNTTKDEVNASAGMLGGDAVARVGKLTEDIWKVMDPNQKDSIDKSELRQQAMVKNLGEFKAGLRDRVKTLLLTRMRRGMNMMRRSLKRLREETMFHSSPDDD